VTDDQSGVVRGRTPPRPDVSWEVTPPMPGGAAAVAPAPLPVAAVPPADTVGAAAAPAAVAEETAIEAVGSVGRSRARARALATGSAPAVPPRGGPLPPGAAGRLFGVHLGQLLVWELVLLAAVVLARESWPVRIAVGVPALVLLALTAVRLRGRWLFQWAGTWLRFRARRRSRPLGADPAGAVLSGVAPGAVLDTLLLGGEPAALVEHAGGLTAVLEVRLGAGPESRAEAGLLPPLSLLLPGADEESEVTVQVLVRSVPAPVLPAGEDPAAISYRELVGGPVPARRRCWVALQVQHTPEDVPAAEQRAVLAAAVERVQRRLRKSGLTGAPLSPEQFRTDLLDLAGAGPAGVVREDWSTWDAGGTLQTGWRVATWPDLTDPRSQRLVEDLLGVPALATTVAVSARRVGTDDVELEAAVRAALPDRAALAAAHRALSEVADGHGARLRRVTGEQAAGAAGTLPLGGFLR